jgi:TatD DNase family protein
MSKLIPYINIHTHQQTQAEDIISIINAGVDPLLFQKNQYVSIGIHPWYITKLNIQLCLEFIQKNATEEKVLAIGECGLDKLIDIPIEKQEQIFIEQIRVAEKVRKPLIIHCVKAFEELMRIKKEEKISVPLIIHGFNNKPELARQLIRQGFYLSFGKALLTNNSNAQQVIQKTDYKFFFLETDDADTSIKAIFEKASELKNCSIEEMKEKMNHNFKTLIHHD